MRAAKPVLMPAILLACLAILRPAVGVQAGERGYSFSADLADRGGGDRDGSGTAQVTIDPGGDWVTICGRLVVENLDHVTDWGIHVGAEGEVGEAVFGFSGLGGCRSLPTADIFDPIMADPAGYYVDVHTAKYPVERFPGGAIRGQLLADAPDTAMRPPTTSPWVTLGLFLVGLAGLLGVASADRLRQDSERRD